MLPAIAAVVAAVVAAVAILYHYTMSFVLLCGFPLVFIRITYGKEDEAKYQ